MNDKTIIESMAPIDWCCFIMGQYYKISRFNRVLVFRLGEWVSTQGVSLKEVYRAIEERNSDITKPIRRRQYVTKNYKKDALNARIARDERMKIRRT